jgi:hypothetical protein
MSLILTLLLGSAAIGFMIAPRHNAGTVVVSSSILALIAATAAWLGGFGLLPSIAITFACVTISQMAYLLLVWLSMGHAGVLANKPSHNQSRQNRQSKIPNKYAQQKNPPPHLTT